MPEHHYVKISTSLRDDVYAKLQDIMEATGLTLSGALALLIMRVDIEQLSREPKDTRAWTLAHPTKKGDTPTES
ncbi:MAG: hypothetical protein KIT87_22765 [Anaerolineae bacterium]|nr:hypothetical protein [Anaerolineae bacterium]